MRLVHPLTVGGTRHRHGCPRRPGRRLRGGRERSREGRGRGVSPSRSRWSGSPSWRRSPPSRRRSSTFAAAVGIGVVWALPTVALGAATLLVVNTAPIVLASTVTLWYLGYRPADRTAGALGQNLRRRPRRRSRSPSSSFSRSSRSPGRRGRTRLGREPGDRGRPGHARAGGVRGADAPVGPGRVHRTRAASGARGVDVVVSRPTGKDYPDLAADVGRSLEEQTGAEVAVSVEFAGRTEFHSVT